MPIRKNYALRPTIIVALFIMWSIVVVGQPQTNEPSAAAKGTISASMVPYAHSRTIDDLPPPSQSPPEPPVQPPSIKTDPAANVMTSALPRDVAVGLADAAAVSVAVAATVAFPGWANKATTTAYLISSSKCHWTDESYLISGTEVVTLVAISNNSYAFLMGGVIMPISISGTTVAMQAFFTATLKGQFPLYQRYGASLVVVIFTYLLPVAAKHGVALAAHANRGKERGFGLFGLSVVLCFFGAIAHVLWKKWPIPAPPVEEVVVATATENSSSEKKVAAPLPENPIDPQQEPFIISPFLFIFYCAARCRDSTQPHQRVLYPVDMAATLMVSMLAGLQPFRTGHCMGISGAMLLVMIAHLVYLIYYKPFLSKLDAYIACGITSSFVLLSACITLSFLAPASLDILVVYVSVLVILSLLGISGWLTVIGVQAEIQKIKLERAGGNQQLTSVVSGGEASKVTGPVALVVPIVAPAEESLGNPLLAATTEENDGQEGRPTSKSIPESWGPAPLVIPPPPPLEEESPGAGAPMVLLKPMQRKKGEVSMPRPSNRTLTATSDSASDLGLSPLNVDGRRRFSVAPKPPPPEVNPFLWALQDAPAVALQRNIAAGRAVAIPAPPPPELSDDATTDEPCSDRALVGVEKPKAVLTAPTSPEKRPPPPPRGPPPPLSDEEDTL